MARADRVPEQQWEEIEQQWEEIEQRLILKKMRFAGLAAAAVAVLGW
jgi:hypothetical protein